MVLRDWVWYNVKVSKSKYKILYYLYSSDFNQAIKTHLHSSAISLEHLIIQFLYINVLNYRYFHTDCSTFFKNKKKTFAK